MRPQDTNDPRNTSPAIPQRDQSLTPSSRQYDVSHQAAASIVRGQINTIYDESAASSDNQSQQNNPYTKSHTTPHADANATEQWAKYHSAWQDYYQKYYERYYIGQVHEAKKTIQTQQPAQSDNQPQAISQPSPAVAEPESISRDEALYDLRSKLRNKATSSAKKARKSRHFIPITAASLVVLVFMFLQFNRILFANVQAYVSPGNIDPANIIVDPTTNVAVSPEPKLIIPKLNIDVPVVYNTTSDYNGQMEAMKNGVAYFGIPGANAKPGQIGNTVLAGHSSNDLIDPGSYKFIFARLDSLKKGDTIYVNYESKRYTYTVTKDELVKPTEVGKLVYETKKPVLTLITCMPLGTALKRLLVTAEQVSPSPADAKKPEAKTTRPNEPATIPGNSPTFIERLFGGGRG